MKDRLSQTTGAKNKLADQMDHLSVSDKNYDKKYNDMQERLDKLYDEISDIEDAMEEVETRLYNIRQDKISEDNVYQFLLFFDKLYDKFTDLEKKTFLKSFLSDVFIYEEEQKDGRILRGLRFKFPIYLNGRNVLGVDWDNESTDETPVIEEKPDIEIEPYAEKYVEFDTFAESDFRVVKVKNCEAVPKSKKLLRFTLDDGSGKERTILSGVHAFYEPEELVGKTLLAIVNLPPRTMMGIDSCGMLLSAIHNVKGEEKLNLIMLDDSIPAGAKLY